MNRSGSNQSLDRLSRRTALTASLGGLAVAGVAGFAAASAQEATPVVSPATAGEATFLFVQSGFSSGSLSANPDGTFQLTLMNAPVQTVYFADRPDRIVGVVATDRFLDIPNFDSHDPPNAALAIEVDAGNTDVIVFELTGVDYDAAGASPTYIAMLLEGIDQYVQTGGGQAEEPLTADTLPQEFGSSSLFIDVIHWNPGGF